MHKHGVPNFPDPTKGQFPGNNTGRIASPSVVQAALQTCFPVSQGAPAWPDAELVIVGDSGHTGSDAMRAEALAATERFKLRSTD
jgi:hypothetical protein